MKDINLKTIIAIALLILAMILNIVLSFRYSAPGDLDTFLASGRAVMNKMNPYNAPSPNYMHSFGNYTSHAYNLNPPISLILFGLLSRFDTNFLYNIWTIISIMLHIFSILLLGTQYRLSTLQLTWAVGISGLWVGIGTGQIYELILPIIVIAWIALERKQYVLAGIMIGLFCTVKINFLVWPSLLFLAGFRRTAIAAYISLVVFSLIPIIIWGPLIYIQWFQMVGKVDYLFVPNNASWFGITLRAGIPWLGAMSAGIFLLLVAAFVFLRKPGTWDVNSLGLVASVLASPIGWASYSIWMLPIFLSRRWNLNLAIAGAILMVPLPLIEIWGQISLIHLNLLSLIYPAGFLIIIYQAAFVRR